MANLPVPVPSGQAFGTPQPMPTTPPAGIPGSPIAATTNTGATNPYAAPTLVAPGTGVPPLSTTNGVNWNDGSFSAVGDMKDTYGAGTGVAIGQVLQNMGTVNDAAVQSTIAGTNYAADKQYANIQAQEAAAGITPGSSTAALAAGDFYAGVNTNLQSVIANMDNNQEQTLLSTLTNTGQQHGGDVSGFDHAMAFLGGGGLASLASGANAINSTSASGTGGFSEVLSAIGMLG